MELKTYVAQDQTGATLAGAVAALYLTGTTTLVTGLTTADDLPLANPMTTNADGVIIFKAPDGIYDIQFNLGPLIGPKITIQCLDLIAQENRVNATAAQAQAIVDEAKLIMDADIYVNTTAAQQDATLLPGKYYRIPAGAGNASAFTYYQKQNSTSSTVVTSIPTTLQTQTTINAMNNSMQVAVFNAVVKKLDPLTSDGSLLYCVRDVNGYQTWLGVNSRDGGPSVHAERMLRDLLKIRKQNNFLAAGEEISWAVTDSVGNLTDLAVRQVDGQLAEYAVRRIGDRILARIGGGLSAAVDALKMPRDAPGFQTLASMTRWAAQRGRGETITGPINFTTPVNSQPGRLTFQTPYSNDAAMLLVIYFGGVGSSTTLTPPTEYAAALSDGIMWARCGFSGDNYGSPSAMADVKDVYAQACKLAPVGGVVLLGNSMGGMPALNALLTKAVPGVLGLYLTDPVCNLADRYNSARQGLIQTAYGIAANGSDYSTKTAGYDPVLRNWSEFCGVPVYCIASTNDDQVPYATNSKLLFDTFGAHLDFVLDTHTTVGHNTADRFDVTALRTFLRKCASGNILK